MNGIVLGYSVTYRRENLVGGNITKEEGGGEDLEVLEKDPRILSKI